MQEELLIWRKIVFTTWKGPFKTDIWVKTNVTTISKSVTVHIYKSYKGTNKSFELAIIAYTLYMFFYIKQCTCLHVVERSFINCCSIERCHNYMFAAMVTSELFPISKLHKCLCLCKQEVISYGDWNSWERHIRALIVYSNSMIFSFYVR